MSYYLYLFSPATYEAFTASQRNIAGVRGTQRTRASRVQPGDKLLCYLTGLSRWVGMLEVLSPPFEDDTPIFYPENDPFAIRFEVLPWIWLPKEMAIPIREDSIWKNLSFTRGLPKNSYQWTGKMRSSLSLISDEDGSLLESLLYEQSEKGMIYPVDEEAYAKMLTPYVRRGGKSIPISVPDSTVDEQEASPESRKEVRESYKIQALLAGIGAQMGFSIWVPKNDRATILQEKDVRQALIDDLPFHYDELTMRTIEQIDVLWIEGRYVVRAFEVEHTTSIYSGLLRMADLLALQPNLDIKLHIVAPDSRRDKVFQELQRPIFSLLGKAPLSERCTYISYQSVHELAQDKKLKHMSDSVLKEYEEEP